MNAAIPSNLRFIFDARLADRLRHEGITTAAQSRVEILALARTLAVWLAMSDPDHETHADAVQQALAELGYTPADLGNAAGAIFMGKHWQWTGRRVRSERPEGHGNEQRVWRLLYDAEGK